MKTNYYLELYKNFNPYDFDLLDQAKTKAERKSVIDRIIKDFKKQEYPKGQTKLVVQHLKSLI